MASATGWAALLALKARSGCRSSGYVLIAPELPGPLRSPVQTHEVREVPDVYGRSMLGWATLPEKLQRDHRDLTLADVLRVQHLLGQKPHESGHARRQMLQGVPVDPRGCRTSRAWSSGVGSTAYVSERDAERLASGSTRSTSRSAPIRITGW